MLATLTLMLALLVGMSGVAAAGAQQAHAQILPPQSDAFGKSYAGWQVAWWQWALSLPIDHHPLTDTADCSAGQAGNHVWFLGGSFSSLSKERDCSMPAGTALFFPILNGYAATLEGDGRTLEELRVKLSSYFDERATMSLEIDGVAVDDLQSYLVQPTAFIYGPLPANSVPAASYTWIKAGDTSLALAEGVYVLLAPLPVGQHTIHFHAVSERQGFTLDFTYHITVAPAR